MIFDSFLISLPPYDSRIEFLTIFMVTNICQHSSQFEIGFYFLVNFTLNEIIITTDS